MTYEEFCKICSENGFLGWRAHSGNTWIDNPEYVPGQGGWDIVKNNDYLWVFTGIPSRDILTEALIRIKLGLPQTEAEMTEIIGNAAKTVNLVRGRIK